MRQYQPFLDHPQIPQFTTMKIGEGLDKPLDITRSHFKNVIEYVEVRFDLKSSYKQTRRKI